MGEEEGEGEGAGAASGCWWGGRGWQRWVLVRGVSGEGEGVRREGGGREWVR